jgi:organic radical activating enzyme
MALPEEWSRWRAYPIAGDGRIHTHALHVALTDHCNLRCAQCDALAPYLDERAIDVDVLRRDLGLAKRALAPTFLKLVGGEPLLHPRVVDCVRAAKDQAIAEKVSLTTNGRLLHRASDALFEVLDHLTISVYPPGLVHLDTIVARAVRFGVELNVKRQDEFQHMTADAPHGRDQDVFETCWLRHRCHTLHEGRFFACTRPPNLQAFHRGRLPLVERDGVSLHDGAGLADEIAAYLERRVPLASCATCLGGTGAFAPHRQLDQDQVRLGVL